MTEKPEFESSDTSFHARKARDGDPASLEWIVQRFSPLLLTQARYRVGPRLQTVADPEDLVAETWAEALPRLADLGERDGRFTPVLVKFLSTILLRRFNRLVRRALRGDAGGVAVGADGEEEDVLARVPDDLTGAVSRAARGEAYEAALAAIDELGTADREIIVLRGIEQLENQDVAAILGIEPGAAAARYSRALRRLRGSLPRSVFEELPDE